eukprot:CAMPEP_0172595576 /NCGR_PEP_ID=MMETSP1068-20121228/15177_1 /TAXON_ID=35684 /ORGANISM="Pseudopedinella elastica, Strain CCMP716" /LENGTH=235 /DNA_ID=CAMNT_0013394177 /DNA_START=61 /DNA_END=768 /DNA_ORIENTATION=+
MTAMGSDAFKRIGRIAKDKMGEVGEKLEPASPAASAVGGALLGGLMGGPFGLIIGAQIGSNLGEKQQQELQLKNLGIDKRVVEDAKVLAALLADSKDAADAARNARDTLKRQAGIFAKSESALYEQAKSMLAVGDEASARERLEERELVKASIARGAAGLAEAEARCARAERDLALVEAKAVEMDDFMRRSAIQSQLQTLEAGGAAGGLLDDILPAEDPLEAKFRALEDKKRRGE